VVVNKQLALQMTMKNSQAFAPEKSSIYKRAAQADILAKAPDDDALDVYDFSILARQLAASEITNQQLIDKSVVLVNGVRIALNLQLVE